MKKYTKFEIQKNNLKFIEIHDKVKKDFSFRCYIQLKSGEINENKESIYITNRNQLEKKLKYCYKILSFYYWIITFFRKPLILYKLKQIDDTIYDFSIATVYKVNNKFIFNYIERSSSYVYSGNETEKKYENEFDFVKNHINNLGYKKFNIEEIINEILFNFINDENMSKFNYELIKNKKYNINDLLSN
ncbi:hypothetical protein [Fusobacterium polymorphum]|uniref:Uncharacterized protein n=1 Tax=Fusobacterium nucleatum subsp. polymorphum TaxID=76857 RepID=A0A2C6BQZ3_FUSNP|nr:hypothetical protein [Fusobacterium polymorphum]PHI06651.1 hypothetical protein CBG54_06185 [Fusobacterium polymorphum]